jgi:hypothetical protein
MPCHRNPVKAHPRRFDEVCFVVIVAIGLEIDDRPDTDRRQIRVVAPLRLRAPVVGRADASEIVDRIFEMLTADNVSA